MKSRKHIIQNKITRFNKMIELPEKTKEDRITELVNRLSKEIPVNARQFHVSEITSIVDIEEELSFIEDADERRFKLASIISERYEAIKKAIYDRSEEQKKDLVILTTDQRYLNNLVPTLRTSEREKYRQFDVSYSPVKELKVPSSPKIPKERMSASDRMMESGAKVMNMTVEQFKKNLTEVLKSKGIICTCQETPGLCKIHP